MSIFIAKHKIINDDDFDKFGHKNLLTRGRNFDERLLADSPIGNPQYTNAIYLVNGHTYIVTADTNGEFTNLVDPSTDNQISMQFGISAHYWQYMGGNLSKGFQFKWEHGTGWQTISVNIKTKGNPKKLYMKNICVVDARVTCDELDSLQSQINQLKSQLGGGKA